MSARTVSRTLRHVLVRTGAGHVGAATVGLLWDAAHPHAVSLIAGPKLVRWLLDRDLLHRGLDAPAGLGDVTVLPSFAATDGEAIELVLNGPGVARTASLLLRTQPLREFLDWTYAITPAGQEQLDLDGPLRDIEGGKAA